MKKKKDKVTVRVPPLCKGRLGGVEGGKQLPKGPDLLQNKLQIHNSAAEFLIFTRQAGDAGIEVRVEREKSLKLQLFGISEQFKKRAAGM